MINWNYVLILSIISTCDIQGANYRPPDKSYSPNQEEECENGSAFFRVANYQYTYLPLGIIILLLLLAIILIMILLGIIKGILGLCCCPPVGMWGLGVLIYLPQPLDRYEESWLAPCSVMYDEDGWPVHPETGDRTVRVISKKTEFCLNVIFFLAYPFAVLCSLCFINEEDVENDECFQSVHRITLTECPAFQRNREKIRNTAKSDVGMYDGEDKREMEDTRYVLNQMHRSRQSLRDEIEEHIVNYTDKSDTQKYSSKLVSKHNFLNNRSM